MDREHRRIALWFAAPPVVSFVHPLVYRVAEALIGAVNYSANQSSQAAVLCALSFTISNIVVVALFTSLSHATRKVRRLFALYTLVVALGSIALAVALLARMGPIA